LAPLADPLTQPGPTHQIAFDGWILELFAISGHHFAAPQVDDFYNFSYILGSL
jgi:hypothetical protein